MTGRGATKSVATRPSRRSSPGTENARPWPTRGARSRVQTPPAHSRCECPQFPPVPRALHPSPGGPSRFRGAHQLQGAAHVRVHNADAVVEASVARVHHQDEGLPHDELEAGRGVAGGEGRSGNQSRGSRLLRKGADRRSSKGRNARAVGVPCSWSRRTTIRALRRAEAARGAEEAEEARCNCTGP